MSERTRIKLKIQIMLLGQLMRFLNWHNKRWDRYFEMKKWNKWYDTFVHVKEMEKEDRVLILTVLPYKDLEEAITWQQWTHVLTGEEF